MAITSTAFKNGEEGDGSGWLLQINKFLNFWERVELVDGKQDNYFPSSPVLGFVSSLEEKPTQKEMIF